MSNNDKTEVDGLKGTHQIHDSFTIKWIEKQDHFKLLTWDKNLSWDLLWCLQKML
jgi:hypothetical protein